MEQLVSFIIRPPRAEYNPNNDLLEQEFMLKGKWYQRKDLEVKNSRGDVLQCSHYMPIGRPEGKPLPCVIYCHGNSGCRADASEAAIILLPLNITVFTLDFSGSGLSGGEYVTLGWNERDDLRAVVDHLRSDGTVSLIGLWGRSMGSVTSLMYGAEDPSIAGIVLDSPFSDLVELMMELVDTYKIRLPKFTVKYAIQFMKRAIQKKAKFDITELNTIKVAKSCFVPALFGHAIDDDFIQPHHSERIFDAYVGDKNIIKFEGDHNSPRPQFYFDSISIFFNNILQPPLSEAGDISFDLSHDYITKGRWNTVHEMRYSDGLPSASPGTAAAAASTEDAIEQLRSKRPMSRVDVPSDISCNDKQFESQDKDAETDAAASSSNMISFDLSNSSPYGSRIPVCIDDDEYVEYALDDLSEFPNNVDDEERMLMEAIMESLKDLDVKKPCDEDLPNISSSDNQEDSSAKSVNSQLKMEGVSKLTENGNCPAVVPNTQQSSIERPQGTAVTPSQERTEKGAPSKSETSSNNNQISSPPDTTDRTTATITVEKTPTSNIMDGLRRRWDLNFFRNK
ncbi:hydrolase [Lithospermum erythrorhizon]|uniref:Hydrolase n=1 Tax=Lithospermum erythrorhizon TaxID=34254 RepID=A0AAV3PDH1_LITER